MITDAAHVFYMFEFVVRPDDKDCARKHAIQRAAGDQDAIVFAERGVPVIARDDNLVDIRGAASAFLSER